MENFDNHNQPLKKKKGRIVYRGLIFRIIFLFLLIAVSTLGYYGYKLYNLEKNIIEIANSENQTETSTLFSAAKKIITSDYKKLKGEEKNRINILLLGMGGEGHSGKYLTDTIMVASINSKTYETALLSIPRDLYVKIPDRNIYTKINAVYSYELRNNNQNSAKAMESVKKVIQEITGQKIDYYFSLNFEGFEKIIDEIGGIDLDVPEDIYDPRYPGPNYSYQTFEIKKGNHHLDGETALKYARVRHTAGGDFARAARQQAIIASTKRKVFQTKTFLNPLKINGLIDALGENLKTDVHFNEIPSFVKISKNINIYQTTNKVLDAWSKDSLLAVSHVELGGVRAFILIPRINNYKEIQALAENIFEINYLERQRQEIEKEKADVLVLLPQYNLSSKIQKILKNSNYQSVIFGNSLQFSEICNNQTKLINNKNEKETDIKIFTINDLIEKFDSKIEDASLEKINQEIILCLNTESIRYFENQLLESSETKKELEEQSIIDKNGNLLFNEER